MKAVKTIPKQVKVLGIFSLTMINVSLICSLRGLPTMAVYGMSVIFFLTVAVIFFLIPTALVSAELATTWPKRGGIYVWVREAFGEKLGFIAICLQWLQNLVFYPTALAATAAVIAYLFNPALAENRVYTLSVIIILYWAAIIVNLRGMKLSGKIASYGTILGIILPGIILLVLGVAWVVDGQPIAIPMGLDYVVPDLSNLKNIVFLTGMFLFFAGMEVSGVHAREVKDPKKNYPKAIFVSGIIVALIFLFGSLSISMIVPLKELSLTAGIMQTFTVVLNEFNIAWMIPVIVLLAAPGMIVQVSSWIAGPSRGLLVTAENGNLPPFFHKINKNNMPVNIMLFQGVVVTLISFVFLVMPSVSSSFWILTDLAALIYLIFYVIMFVTALKLRKTQPNIERPYSVPGGKYGIWVFCLMGISACVSAFVLGFIPPIQLSTGGLLFYDLFLGIGVLVTIAFPFVLYHLRKPSWKKKIVLD